MAYLFFLLLDLFIANVLDQCLFLQPYESEVFCCHCLLISLLFGSLMSGLQQIAALLSVQSSAKAPAQCDVLNDEVLISVDGIYYALESG